MERTVGDQIEQALRFARGRLGPASEQFATDPGIQALLLARIREGVDFKDAVLGE